MGGVYEGYVSHSRNKRAIYESLEIWMRVCWGGGGGVRDF